MQRPLLQGSVAIFAGSVVAGGVAFLIQAILARAMGPRGFGTYRLVLAWVAASVPIAELGFDTATIRFAANYQAAGSFGSLRGLVRRGTQIVLGASCAVAVGMVLVSWAASRGVFPYFVLGACLMPLQALLNLNKSTLIALKHPIGATVVALVMRQFGFAALILVSVYLLRIQLTAGFAIACSGITWLAVLLASYALLRVRLPQQVLATPAKYHTAQWLSTSFSFLFVTFMQVASSRSDLIMVGLFRSRTDVGVYGAAVLLTSLLDQIVACANSILAPWFAEAHGLGRTAELQRLVTRATRGVFLTLLVPGLILLAFARQILLLLGEGYGTGRFVLSVLVISFLVRGFTGSVGLLLGMSGEQALLAKAMTATAIAKLGFDLLLIPAYGMSGAAISMLLGSVVRSAALGVLTLVRVRIAPTPAGTWIAQLTGVGETRPAEVTQ
jgi:O-antigen/teichoic acid export membrane protein